MATYYYAIKTLLANRINELPITSKKLEGILRDIDWEVIYYDLKSDDSICILKKADILEYAQMHNGLSLKREDLQCVFVNNNLSTEDKTFVLAHELGHITMAHFSDTGILGKHKNSMYDDQQEIEANEFARHLLAPECILKSVKLKSLEDIEKATLLKNDTSKIHYADFCRYKSKLTTDERQLIGNFKNYIDKNKKKSNKKTVIEAVASAVLVGTLLLSGRLFAANPNQPLHSISNVSEANKPINSQIIDVEDKSLTVYKAKTGKVYHKTENCSYIKGHDGILSLPIGKAQEIGLKPCSRCFK